MLPFEEVETRSVSGVQGFALEVRRSVRAGAAKLELVVLLLTFPGVLEAKVDVSGFLFTALSTCIGFPVDGLIADFTLFAPV